MRGLICASACVAAFFLCDFEYAEIFPLFLYGFVWDLICISGVAVFEWRLWEIRMNERFFGSRLLVGLLGRIGI